MNEYSYLVDQLAAEQIAERVSTAKRLRSPGVSRRRLTRHTLASGLHSLADRLDN